MHCKKYIQKSSTITAIKKVIYANKICLALAKEQKLFIYSLDMQKIKEMNVYATIHQIIPFNNKFICFSSNCILEVSETGIQKSLIEQHINCDEISHTIDTKNYFMFVYRNGGAFLYHKTDNQHVFEGEINDFYQMNVIDMHAEGNHLYVIHKGQDKVAKPYGNENVYTNYLSYYKYHNKQIILIDSIDIKESYKIVAYNKNIILLDNNSVYKVIMEEIQSQTSKPKETEEGDKQSNRKKPDMRYEYVCKNICSAPTCFVSYLSGVLISCNNTEIIYFDGFKLESKGFLMREISQIIILQSDKLLGITKDGGSITFDVHDKSNTQKKERFDHLSGACAEKKNPFVSVHRYDNIENIDPDFDQSLSSINVNEYFTSKQLTIIKQSHSKRYDGQIKFIDNNLVVINKTDPVILTYGLSKKVTNVIKTNERIRKIFCYDDLLFISFFDSFQINNILKNKNVYEHDKSIKNFYALEKSDIKHYSMNTENEFITDQNFYTLDYTIILSAFHKNYKLLYGLKNDKYFLILCEIENLISEIEVETNISMLYLDDNIYVSTYEDTFTVYDYSFNVIHTENRCSFRFCYKVRDNLLFITNSGLFFSFVNKTFVQLFNLDQNILSMCQIKDDVFFIKANKSYIMQFDTKKFSGNSLGKAVQVTQTKTDYSYMTQNKNNLLCVNNRKIEICDNTIDFRIRKKRIQVVKSIEDFVMINEKSKLIIEQKVEKDQDRNTFTVVCRYTYNGKRKKTFELQNSIYKTCKLFMHDVYIFVVNRNNGSEIIFCRFGKKLKCLFSKCFDEQIMCATTFDEYLAIGFCNYFTICKFVNNTIILIYTNKMLPSVIDIAFCNYKDQLYLIVNDAISSFCKFKIQRESNTVEFAEFMDVKVSKLHVYNNMLYSNDDHSISLYDFETNSLSKKIKTENRIQSMTVGSLLVLDKQKIYVNDSIGNLYALIDICDALTKEECKRIMELQSKICLNSNILYNEEFLNYEILSECIDEQLLHEFDFTSNRYAEILECLKTAY